MWQTLHIFVFLLDISNSVAYIYVKIKKIFVMYFCKLGKNK